MTLDLEIVSSKQQLHLVTTKCDHNEDRDETEEGPSQGPVVRLAVGEQQAERLAVKVEAQHCLLARVDVGVGVDTLATNLNFSCSFHDFLLSKVY